MKNGEKRKIYPEEKKGRIYSFCSALTSFTNASVAPGDTSAAATVSPWPGLGLAPFQLLVLQHLDFFYERVQVLERAVHRGKPDVRDFVDFFQPP